MKLVFIDTETTGLDPVRHGIIQLAGIVCAEAPDGTLTELETFDWTCAPYPSDVIEKSALDVNRRKPEDIAAFDSPVAVHANLTALLARHVDKYTKTDKAWFAGYNANFDAQFVREWFRKAGDKFYGAWFWSSPIDAMTLAAVRLRHDRASMPNFQLATVAAKLGVPPFAAHDALADVRAAKAIYEICTQEPPR